MQTEGYISLGLFYAHLEVMNLGRKNKRKKTEYRDRLGFDPRKYVRRYCPPPAPPYPARPPYPHPIWNGGRCPHRGDIWFADLGEHPGTSVQSGCRPVLIVSNDIGNEHAETLNVLPMTRQLKKPGLPCHTELTSSVIIDKHQEMGSSMVLAEQITTISKTQLRNYVGRLDDATLLTDIDTAVGQQLSLTQYGTNYQSEKPEESYSHEQ